MTVKSETVIVVVLSATVSMESGHMKLDGMLAIDSMV